MAPRVPITSPVSLLSTRFRILRLDNTTVQILDYFRARSYPTRCEHRMTHKPDDVNSKSPLSSFVCKQKRNINYDQLTGRALSYPAQFTKIVRALAYSYRYVLSLRGCESFLLVRGWVRPCFQVRPPTEVYRNKLCLVNRVTESVGHRRNDAALIEMRFPRKRWVSFSLSRKTWTFFCLHFVCFLSHPFITNIDWTCCWIMSPLFNLDGWSISWSIKYNMKHSCLLFCLEVVNPGHQLMNPWATELQVSCQKKLVSIICGLWWHLWVSYSFLFGYSSVVL